ncbi:MAG: methyltransferase domain-containing protein [Clostridia bacterium]|nr:methyltransferase domain-containing protein [Clostridia bacterium]MBQ4603435.1 methyltransferase domain-containing protein [Clostridia bacterium]
MNFICPVCRGVLSEEERLYRCGKGHCFDKSKFGYVNLLQSQKSSAKRHGDDRMMIRARRDFLDGGYYGFLRDAVCEICGKYIPHGGEVLDAGCGECWYSAGLKQYYSEKGKEIVCTGIDISKDALEFASKRKSGIRLAVASLFDLPFADESFDLVMNIFSPEADTEFRRVLKADGYMIRVIPLEKHLLGLKSAIYDKPYLNDVPVSEIDGFDCVESKQLKAVFFLSTNEEIQNLFKMTPYYYKTGVDDQQKINNIDKLEVQAEFEIRVYRKD